MPWEKITLQWCCSFHKIHRPQFLQQNPRLPEHAQLLKHVGSANTLFPMAMACTFNLFYVVSTGKRPSVNQNADIEDIAN